MGRAAVAAAQAVHYQNAGTIEFIVDPRTREFYFLEMNTRLQVEHPVTELVTGLDLVKLQIRVAAGERLPFAQDDLSQRGHAIECRVYAEDPANGFLPAIGPVLKAVEPRGPGIRVDAGVETGDEVTLHYDPLIAKVVVHAETRAEAIRRMDRALAQYAILGVTTNIAFLRDVLAGPVFQRGEATTAFIESEFSNWKPRLDDELIDLALIAAALSEATNDRFAGRMTKAMTHGVHDPWQANDRFRIGG
jgi:acetyl/propionyl-CoA carboxylase alpha subunit